MSEDDRGAPCGAPVAAAQWIFNLRYVDGKVVYTAIEGMYPTEADSDRVNKAFISAGPDGATCSQIAEAVGMPLAKVQMIVGEELDA
jgi:hypothetical protein